MDPASGEPKGRSFVMQGEFEGNSAQRLGGIGAEARRPLAPKLRNRKKAKTTAPARASREIAGNQVEKSK